MKAPSARAALRIYGTVFAAATEDERAAILRSCMTEDVEVVFPSGYRAVGPAQVAYLMTCEGEGREPNGLERDRNPTLTGLCASRHPTRSS